jgi:NAD(P)-dependent dehydrogenase (short-subunit alcohol dehydrogenase family)
LPEKQYLLPAAPAVSAAQQRWRSRVRVRVIVSDIAADSGQETARMMTEAGGDAIFIQADVSAEPGVIALIERAVAAFGRLDCAFNNAGIEEEQNLLADCDEQLFDRIMNVNVKGAWLCMKHEIR